MSDLIHPAARIAEAAGLIYVTDDEPGIRRRRRGKGFSYHAPDGSQIRDDEALKRIKGLAIPPAWTEVWIASDPTAHIQATGRDAKGRKQYRYHTRWGEERSNGKYERLIAFSDALPAIREQVEHDLKRQGLPREKVLATIVRLLETTFIRIGNARYARSNLSYGLTTLRDRHVRVQGTRIRFKFRGKSGQEHEIELQDRRLAHIIQRSRDLPGQELFQYIDENGMRQDVDSTDVNEYLRSVAGQDFSAKDFRTWGGTLLALRELRSLDPPESQRAAKKTLTRVVCSVSNLLGNRPSTCRKYYIHPAVLEAYADGSLAATVGQLTGKQVVDAPHDMDFEEAALRALLGEAKDEVEEPETVSGRSAVDSGLPATRRSQTTRVLVELGSGRRKGAPA